MKRLILILANVCLPVLALVVTSQPARAADEAAAEDAKPASEETAKPAGAADGATAEDAKPAPKKTPKEQFKDVWNRDTVTGDWMGWRTDLLDHGIDVKLRLSQYGQWVAGGGVRTSSQYGLTMDYRVNADLRKLFGMWEGLSVDMHARSRSGHDINADAGELTFPNVGLLTPLPGSYDGSGLTGLQASQMLPFFGGRLANVTAGKIDVIDTVTMFFPSVGYGQEGFWNLNALVTSLPWLGAVQGLSLYGGYAVTINQEFQGPESGFLALGTENVTTTSGSIHDSFDDGVWLAAFHRFYYKLDEKPGFLMVFAGGSTRSQVSNDPHDFTAIPGQGIVSTDDEKPWDIAAYISQVFWQVEDDPDRKATILVGGTGGPDDPQIVQWNVFAAVEAYGPMASRPHDRMGVSFWYNWYSDDFKDLVSPVVDLRDFYGFEIYYNIAINKWFHVTPDLQLIENEIDGDDLAIIPGVRGVIDF